MKTEIPNKLMLRFYNKNRPIRAVCSIAKSAMELHCHDYYEIEIIISGEAVHYLNGEKYDIGPGIAYILNPAAFHTYEIKKPLKLFCINFDGSVIPERLFFKMATVGAGKHIKINEDRIEDITKLSELLVKECKKRDGGCSMELCECVLAMLLEEIENVQNAPSKIDVGMQKALIYLNSHFYEDPSLADVAKEANYHPNYFSEKFNSYFGESYISKLNELKINYAKVLLNTGFSVSEVCFRAGFHSMSSFLKVFKDRVGKSPKKYQQDNAGNTSQKL